MLGGPAPPLLLEGSVLRVGDRIVLGRTSATTADGGLTAMCMRQQQCWGGPAPSLLLDGSVLCVRDRSSVGEDQRHHCCWRAQC